MKINLSDELIERVEKHLKETGSPQSIEALIEEAADQYVESYPWFVGDICVHNDECMHHKSVEDWKSQQGGE
ncbi:MAG: ribbon-helix-helix domain-containing protein [Treponema sp.]|jgi:metal-responsive CopG/Arc/MetJ family transcriptional regulator|nr:ribbon-helix-helix domain-containing protein [Treponema sp.]